MSNDRRRQIEALCLEAAARDATGRAAFLDEACGDDAELRREVQSMLAVQPDAEAFLETPAWAVPAASLTPGSRLGPYEIHSFIGEGGMGVVYKARDTRLDRTVAIKVLRDDAWRDPGPSTPRDRQGRPEHGRLTTGFGSPRATPPDERRARFEVEARTIAGLSHPHICTLYDVGDHEGSMFLVMEYLDGETLAARLVKGPLPLQQALAIAAEIADALSAAHRQGVVHRDLKPGNVMLTKAGGARPGSPQAKLLDFGVAKLRGREVGGAALQTAAMTRTPTEAPLTGAGTIVGTPQYMAPEQLEGKPADARTDLWALGAMLYEMITGKRAFAGDSAPSLIAAILERDPEPIASLQPLTPPMLDRLVRQCLAKSPDDRPDSAHDVANALRWIREAGDAVSPARTGRRRHRALPVSIAAATLLAAAIVGALMMWWLREAPPGRIIQSALSVEPAERLDGGVISGSNSGSGIALTPAGSRTAFTWSPDGRLVFVGRRDDVRRLYVRRLESARAQELPNTEGAHAPAVSPDGQWVAFLANGSIKKVPLAGGQPVNLARTGLPFGFAWTADGRLLFATSGRVREVSSGEALPRQVSGVDPEHNRHDLPCLLPGGRTLLYTGKKRVYSWGSDEEILAQDLATGGTKALPIRDATDVRYVASGAKGGHLLFLRRGVLFAVAFDPERVEVVGEQVPVLEGTVAQALTGSSSEDITGAGHFAVSPAGMLAWVPGPIGRNTTKALVTVNRLGHVTSRRPPTDSYANGMSLAHVDSRRLAVTVRSLAGVTLGIRNLEPSAPALLNTEGESMWPVWSPDAKRIAFLWLNGGRYSLVLQSAEDPASRQVLARGVFIPTSFTPDGRHLVAVRDLDGIVTMTVHAQATVESVLETRAGEKWPLLSPDGEWLAYASDATGRFEVFVRPYPAPGRVEPVSGEGGSNPVWRPDGRELFFLAPAGGKRRMMAVDFVPGSPPRIGQPHILFEFDPRDLNFDCTPVRCYEVSPDGRQFYVWQNDAPPPLPPVTHINIIENWVEHLKEKAPARK